MIRFGAPQGIESETKRTEVTAATQARVVDECRLLPGWLIQGADTTLETFREQRRHLISSLRNLRANSRPR